MAEYNPSKIIKDGNTYNFRDTTKIPLSGSNAISGSLIPSTDNSVNLGDSTYGFASFYTNKIYLKGSTIFKLVDDNFICLGGATAQANGANLTLNGKNRSTSTGEFKLEARDGTYTQKLIGKPDGTLTWNGKNIDCIEEQGAGYIRYSNGIQICRGSVTNNNNIDTGKSIYTLPKAFNNSSYSLILTAQSNAVYYVSVMENSPGGTVYKTATQFGVFYCDRAMNLISGLLSCDYVAIGTWK